MYFDFKFNLCWVPRIQLTTCQRWFKTGLAPSRWQVIMWTKWRSDLINHLYVTRPQGVKHIQVRKWLSIVANDIFDACHFKKNIFILVQISIKFFLMVQWNIYQLWHILKWRHNGHNGVSNHPPDNQSGGWFVCLGTDQRKHQSSESLAFERGIHRSSVPLTGGFPSQRASNAENVRWRHHVINDLTSTNFVSTNNFR